MPSKSPAQAKLMAAAAHTPGGYGGVSQKTGQDFNSADKGGSMLHDAMMNRKRVAQMKKNMGPPDESTESNREKAREKRLGIP